MQFDNRYSYVRTVDFCLISLVLVCLKPFVKLFGDGSDHDVTMNSFVLIHVSCAVGCCRVSL
jgi:hypothetical protein